MTTNHAFGPWIYPPKTSENFPIKLICFPSAGSGAAQYRLWPDALGPRVGIYRIQPPGRETRFREHLLTSFHDYVDSLVAALTPILDGPFAFFGHSMGSIVAFQVARRLRASTGKVPRHLFVSAFRSPQAPPMRRIFELPEAEFVRELQERYDGIPDQLLNEPEVLALMLPIVRADLAVIAGHTYEPEAPLPCPISAFGGIDDRWVDEAQLGEWRLQTSASFDLKMFAGNHYYLNAAGDEIFAAILEGLTMEAREASA